MSDPDRDGGRRGVEEPEAPAIDPAEFEALKVRAEGAERKLREIQGTFTAAKAELDATRARLERDLESKVEIRFADLVADLLECADDLDRALEHGQYDPGREPRSSPVSRWRATGSSRRSSKAGLERIDPVGEPYDPNVAEAVGVVPVDDPAEHDTVVQLERAGYKLAGRVIRPARVLVGQVVS